jgi:ribokinase
MPRVLVVGSSNTDLTVRVPRLPTPGQTILGSSFATSPGGKGANQAVAARRAGAEVVFITAVGDDEMGRNALAGYDREGIDISHVKVVAGAASGVALIFVDDHSENMIGVAPGANLQLSPDDIARLPDDLFRPADVLLVSLEIPIETAESALRRASTAGMTTILNPAPAPRLTEPRLRELLAFVSLITPNRVEVLALAGGSYQSGVEPSWSQCGHRLIALGAKGAVITQGNRGCIVVADVTRSIPTPTVDAVDTVGAGDAFNGALAAAIAANRPLPAAAAWACAAGALATTKPGAQAALPDRAAIDRLVATAVY